MSETCQPPPTAAPPGPFAPTLEFPAGRRERVLEWIKSNPELPTPPAVALRVIDRASDPECDPAELAGIVSHDPALCAKVLRTVNSAVYGLRVPIGSIPVAVRFLGVHPLRSLVLAFTLSNIRWSPLPAKLLQKHWRVSVAGALAARQLAVLTRRPAPDNHLVAGLLRDLGVFVLYQLFPADYPAVLESSPESRSAFQCDLEEEAIGVNHAEVSAELLKLWHLPEDITEPVRLHHDLDSAGQLAGHHRDSARLLYLASQIGQLHLTPHRPLLVREVLTLAQEECKIDQAGLRGFLDTLGAQMSEFAATMDVDIGEGSDLGAVVSRGVEEFARLAVSGASSGKFPAVRRDPAAPREAGRTAVPGASSTRPNYAPPPQKLDDGAALRELQERLFPGPRKPGEPLGVLDGYEVRELLGHGAMGAVFRAVDRGLERPVAIKTLLPHRVADKQAMSRFLQEGKAVAALTHDNIVRVYAVGEAAGIPYLVMEYVQGMTLAARLQKEAPLPLAEIVRLGLDAASGLSAAHAQGLVHRDVKPANLLVQEGTGRVKIVDFGLVKVAGKSGVSEPGRVLGTPYFMSPEQAEGQTPDCRTDLFSLGSVLYYACTGRRPFEGSTLLTVLRAVAEENPRPVRALNPALPAWLEELVAGLLTKDPARRYPTAAELRRLLLCRWARLFTGRNAEGGVR